MNSKVFAIGEKSPYDYLKQAGISEFDIMDSGAIDPSNWLDLATILRSISEYEYTIKYLESLQGSNFNFNIDRCKKIITAFKAFLDDMYLEGGKVLW